MLGEGREGGDVEALAAQRRVDAGGADRGLSGVGAPGKGGEGLAEGLAPLSEGGVDDGEDLLAGGGRRRRLVAVDDAGFTSVFQGAVRFNNYVGVMLATGLYGAEGTALAAVANAAIVPTVNVLSVLVFSRYGAARPSWAPTATTCRRKSSSSRA